MSSPALLPHTVDAPLPTHHSPAPYTRFGLQWTVQYEAPTPAFPALLTVCYCSLILRPVPASCSLVFPILCSLHSVPDHLCILRRVAPAHFLNVSYDWLLLPVTYCSLTVHYILSFSRVLYCSHFLVQKIPCFLKSASCSLLWSSLHPIFFLNHVPHFKFHIQCILYCVLYCSSPFLPSVLAFTCGSVCYALYMFLSITSYFLVCVLWAVADRICTELPPQWVRRNAKLLENKRNYELHSLEERLAGS